MVAPVMLTADEVAERVSTKYPGISITGATWRRYVYGGRAPRADQMKGRTPLWRASTADEWAKTRPGRGAGGGRPRRTELAGQMTTDEAPALVSA